jgi:hypothetical protein
MRLEQLPILIGVLIALLGLTILLDAWQAGGSRRLRGVAGAPGRRSKAGQSLVALGTLCMAAALMGRDTWRWGTIAVLAGITRLLIGAVLNRTYLKEVLLFRGAARRGQGETHSRLNQTPTKTRIR